MTDEKVFEKRVFTIETRLEKSDIGYFLDYIGFYCKVCREVWQHYVHGGSLDSRYVTEICSKYNLLKRTVNSIIQDVKGRWNALVELQKQQSFELAVKIKSIDTEIADLKNDIAKAYPVVKSNKASGRMLLDYKNNKTRLFSLQRKRQRCNDRIAVMKDRHKLAFGSRAMMLKQFYLEENGYRTHKAWLNDYRKARDKYIYFIGSSDETCGNQMFQMSYDKNVDTVYGKPFHIKVRMEKDYCNKDRYLELDVNFKADCRVELIKALQEGKPVSYRILRRGNKWYLQAMFKMAYEVMTDTDNGCIGIDFNDGFLAISETDNYGNLTDTCIIKLRYHGGGNKAKTEMQNIVKHITDYCLNRNKALVIEDLSFDRKKAGCLHKKKKPYNKMIHMLDYSRFASLCGNSAIVKGVMFLKVNPAYTSITARNKYCYPKKLNVHSGASFVIARIGQGYSDITVA